MRMNSDHPPSIPTWLLEHCTPGGSDPSLRGDLIEEFRSGRSAAWYWRQALAVLAIGCLRDLRNHRRELVFGAFWSMLAPGWLFLAGVVTQRAANAGHIWQLPWPWSALCSSALSFAPGLLFVWAGMLVYLLPQWGSHKRFRILRVGRSVVLSALVFLVIASGLVWVPLLFPSAGSAVDSRGPALSIAPTAPFIVPKNLGGGSQVTVTHNQQGKVVVHIANRVYVEPPDSPWPKQPFQLDRNAPAHPPATPLAAIEEQGAWPLLTRLTFFLCLLFALWKSQPESRRQRA
jgi:hypothetical protein